jgi:hypothetical protein
VKGVSTFHHETGHGRSSVLGGEGGWERETPLRISTYMAGKVSDRRILQQPAIQGVNPFYDSPYSKGPGRLPLPDALCMGRTHAWHFVLDTLL